MKLILPSCPQPSLYHPQLLLHLLNKVAHEAHLTFLHSTLTLSSLTLVTPAKYGSPWSSSYLLALNPRCHPQLLLHLLSKAAHEGHFTLLLSTLTVIHKLSAHLQSMVTHEAHLCPVTVNPCSHSQLSLSSLTLCTPAKYGNPWSPSIKHTIIQSYQELCTIQKFYICSRLWNHFVFLQIAIFIQQFDIITDKCSVSAVCNLQITLWHSTTWGWEEGPYQYTLYSAYTDCYFFLIWYMMYLFNQNYVDFATNAFFNII